MPAVPPPSSSFADEVVGDSAASGWSSDGGSSATAAAARPLPPWSSRNGGYSSRIRSTYAATRATQRSSPRTKSKIPPRVARGEEQRDAGEEDEHADQARLRTRAPDPVVVARARGRVAPASEEDPDDDVLRDREQPPLHEHEPARQPLRVRDVEPRRVVRNVVERERRVAVGAERARTSRRRPATSSAAPRR